MWFDEEKDRQKWVGEGVFYSSIREVKEKLYIGWSGGGGGHSERLLLAGERKRACTRKI